LFALLLFLGTTLPGHEPHAKCLSWFFNMCDSNMHGERIKIVQIILLPTVAQENCFKRSIKIYIKTAPTCFGAITIIRERTIPAR
jgi:hypothetical protein